MPTSPENIRTSLSGPGHHPDSGYSFPLILLDSVSLPIFNSLQPGPSISAVSHHGPPIPLFKGLSFPGPFSRHFQSSFVFLANFSLFLNNGVPINPACFPFPQPIPAPMQCHAQTHPSLTAPGRFLL